jgi:DNA-binding CsgD family transcriptional regulator
MQDYQQQKLDLIKQLKQVPLLKLLAKREVECLCLRLNCRRAWEIAGLLNISKRTVDIHFHHTAMKLGQMPLSQVSDQIRQQGVRHLVDQLCLLLSKVSKKLPVQAETTLTSHHLGSDVLA